MSNLVTVNVNGQPLTQDLNILSLSPLIKINIVPGRVQSDSGNPVQGATVWAFGELARTTTEADGSFQLVSPVPALIVDNAYIAVAGDRWGLLPRSSSGSSIVITLDRKPPLPAPPVQVYDFVAQAADAAWRNGGNATVWNLPDTDPRGFAIYRNGMVLEDGSRPARFLEAHPQWTNGGSITGTYSQVITFQKDDYFVGRVGFMQGANSGKVRFSVTFVPAGPGLKILTEIVSREKTYSGGLEPLVGGIPDEIAGVPGNIRLSVSAGETSSQDWAAWAEAQIVRPN
jgi:hypothetical protein